MHKIIKENKISNLNLFCDFWSLSTTSEAELQSNDIPSAVKLDLQVKFEGFNTRVLTNRVAQRKNL